MRPLIESYNQLFGKVKAINDKIINTESEIKKLTEDTSGETAIRIERLEAQLAKIEEYIPRIKGFQELAKKNLDSQNVLTIEAPPGYRVNLNRLRNWSMMIDPSSSNDPYAQRVYIVAKCDECFLETKKQEFIERIEELKNDKGVGISEEIEKLDQQISSLRSDMAKLVSSGEVALFSKEVMSENEKYRYIISPNEYVNKEEPQELFAPGAYAVPLPVDQDQRLKLKELMGDYYDVTGGRVLLPVEIDNNKEYILNITCAPSKRKQLDRALQNLVLNQIDSYPAGRRKVHIIDGVRFNSSALGSLRPLEGTFVIGQVPRNPEQLTTSLEEIVSSFADIDEIIEKYDSVTEYNTTVEPSKKITLSTMVLYGWPSAYEGRDRELIQRLMVNYERYGISFITVNYRNSDKDNDADNKIMPEYALQNAIQISMMQKETYITLPEGTPQRFTWYSFTDELSQSYVDTLMKCETLKSIVGNEYTKRYSLVDIPEYTRAYKKLELPFGIDGNDEAHSVSFENENFATYLVGASRSGKSTLLHTLIAGLIRNYHPDNVELWLADFKQLEFKRYMNHMPPHVKYILLDESEELVFDLIDKMTDVMLDRQKLFARLGVQRIDQVNPISLEAPLPVIFVILDEFSIMSQSIAEDPSYKLKLQNILAKGAALGIRFLFSSQTFTTGVAGLTLTARAQIQQRIAMKGSKEEISETLELSSNLKTEQVKNWMDALPPHYALVKFRKGADTLPEVKRYLVMYFEDYAPRDQMIDRINAKMKSVATYNTSDINSYTDKHPVCVDGNTFDVFDETLLKDSIASLKQDKGDDLTGEETFLAFGTPRLMERMKLELITNETRENILLIARTEEQSCTASIILSTIKSFISQSGEVELWVYGKNSLYRAFRNVFKQENVRVIEDLDDVCDAIARIKKCIQQKYVDHKLIVLIGMDRICGDFEFADGASGVIENHKAVGEININSAAYVTTEAEQKKTEMTLKWFAREDELREKYKSEGKSDTEIENLIDEEMTAFFDVQKAEKVEDSDEAGTENDSIELKNSDDTEIDYTEKTGAYNALSDLQYIMTRGCRAGYHFLLLCNQLDDVKMSGAKVDWFRHRLSFQVSADDSRELFQAKTASTLPEHICQYSNQIDRYSFRPYLHPDISWEGWFVGEDGTVFSPFGSEE